MGGTRAARRHYENRAALSLLRERGFRPKGVVRSRRNDAILWLGEDGRPYTSFRWDLDDGETLLADPVDGFEVWAPFITRLPEMDR